jgi:hypothetical protein
MVADLAALDEFGRDWRDHEVVAMGTAYGSGESAEGREPRPIFLKMHVTASFSSPTVGAT